MDAGAFRLARCGRADYPDWVRQAMGAGLSRRGLLRGMVGSAVGLALLPGRTLAQALTDASGDGPMPRFAPTNVSRSVAVDRNAPAPASVGKSQFDTG